MKSVPLQCIDQMRWPMVDDVSQALFVVHNRSGTLKDFYSTLQFFSLFANKRVYVLHSCTLWTKNTEWSFMGKKKIGFQVKSFVIPSLQFLCPYCKSFFSLPQKSSFLVSFISRQLLKWWRNETCHFTFDIFTRSLLETWYL